MKSQFGLVLLVILVTVTGQAQEQEGSLASRSLRKTSYKSGFTIEPYLARTSGQALAYFNVWRSHFSHSGILGGYRWKRFEFQLGVRKTNIQSTFNEGNATIISFGETHYGRSNADFFGVPLGGKFTFAKWSWASLNGRILAVPMWKTGESGAVLKTSAFLDDTPDQDFNRSPTISNFMLGVNLGVGLSIPIAKFFEINLEVGTDTIAVADPEWEFGGTPDQTRLSGLVSGTFVF